MHAHPPKHRSVICIPDQVDRFPVPMTVQMPALHELQGRIGINRPLTVAVTSNAPTDSPLPSLGANSGTRGLCACPSSSGSSSGAPFISFGFARIVQSLGGDSRRDFREFFPN